jgi:phage tail sheath protein FI
VIGAQGIQFPLDDSDQDPLNAAGVNVLRVFAGSSRPVVWGARTTAKAGDLPWRYVNVRRLMSFIEESVQEGIRWAVFEPNDLRLWKRIERTITEFLTRVWASGALFGASAEEAFYVKIDEELNPSPVRDLGQVVVEIGVAPVRPAEFVRVKIGLWSGGAQAEEG